MTKVYIAEFPGLAGLTQDGSVPLLPVPPTAEYVLNTTTGGTGPVATFGAITAGSAYPGVIATHGAITAGSGYAPDAVYNAVPLTGGTGNGATANITVAGGAVTVVTIVSGGTGYTVSDVLSASDANLGG